MNVRFGQFNVVDFGPLKAFKFEFTVNLRELSDYGLKKYQSYVFCITYNLDSSIYSR